MRTLRGGIRAVAVVLACGAAFPLHAASHEREVVAYFPEWGVYLQPYYVKHIVESGSAQKITVLNYSFAVPAPDANGDITCQLDDPYAAYLQHYDEDMAVDALPDTASQGLRGHFNQLRKLKEKHPHIKILAALGGWLGSTWFSDAALTAESRQTFVDSCIDLFIHGNLPPVDGVGGDEAAAGIFDGFDIDWEYPITGGAGGTHHNSNDDVNLTALLAEFRQQLDAIDPGYLLTMATPASDFRGDNFQIHLDQQHVDWFNLMSYDFHGGWEKKTGHLTNLLTSPSDPSSDAFKLSLDNTVRLYRDKYGVTVEKLVAGAAFYGRGWKNVGATNNGLYQSGQVAPGIYEDGYNYYKDLIPLMLQGYELYWDPHSLASWLYSEAESMFWTLDEPQSLALKRRYVDAYGLRGIMFWEISGDDAVGTLLSAVDTGDPAPQQPNKTEVDYLNVAIIQPVDCAISLEGFNIVINASADESVEQVEFFQNGQSLGFDNRPPWSWAWFNLPPGQHQLTTVATGGDGLHQESDPVGLTVYGADAGVALWQTGVSYQVGDEAFYEGCIYRATRNHYGSRVRKPDGGRYWELVTCSDCGSGGGGGDNLAPTVQITSPKNNDEFVEGSDVEIVAQPADENGTIVSVEFYRDDVWLETAGDSPYSVTWEDVPTGSYELKAIAYDNEGAWAEDSVNITVAGAGGCTLMAWYSNATYQKNDLVVHNSIQWKAKRTNTNVEPGTSPAYWSNLGTCVE